MKKLFSVLVFMLALTVLTAGAAEVVLVDTVTVAENASSGLAGAQYRVVFDNVARVVTFKIKGMTTAANCSIVFQAITVKDDATPTPKTIVGYNGNAGHTPAGNVAMTNAGGGWLAFSINAANYTPNLGMFLTVVLRQDNARNLERFFGISSMAAPNDWANFNNSWGNMIKITVPVIIDDPGGLPSS